MKGIVLAGGSGTRLYSIILKGGEKNDDFSQFPQNEIIKTICKKQTVHIII